MDSEENKLLLSLMIREIFKDLVLFESDFKGQIRFQIKGVAKKKQPISDFRNGLLKGNRAGHPMMHLSAVNAAAFS